MKSQLKHIAMLTVFVLSIVLSAFPMAQAAEAKGTVTRIGLVASAQYPNAKGTAKYKVDGVEREFQVEIQNVVALAGKTLNVIVNGKKVGSFVVNGLGVGRLNLNTVRGNNVPMIQPGSTVRIKFGIKLVASGTF
jgi:serine protease inhibitor ecotin